MISVKVELDMAAIDYDAQWLSDFHHRLEDPSVALDRAIRGIAEVWKSSFESEGSLVGGWTPLADATIARWGEPDRMLHRTGALESAAIGTFLAANGYGGLTEEEGISAGFTIQGDTAELSLGGYKTVHQTGSWTPPAREFWFTNTQETSDAVLQAVLGWLHSQAYGGLG